MHTLLDQFLDELTCLGLNEAQVRAHLVFLRLWQRHIQPARLLAGAPQALPTFLARLAATEAPRAEVLFAEEAIAHFYAFALDRHPAFPTREAWTIHLAGPVKQGSLPVWEAVEARLGPVLRRLSPPWLRWEPEGAG
ncbi:MAG: hypothetical protein VKQ33_11320 [Candidatus Sericytochromatia bacterium]|nr:hypothetical protein [Candidatus Sericytochromatia bacterium]